MKIAIVLAVSQYQNTSCLQGCVLDGELVNSLLTETGEYNDILLINETTNSISVKKQITELVENNKDKAFDEVVFYYTGHGDFRDGEFYYILSDFDTARYRQTTLSNSELDSLLRELKPGLTVKIIDACHSGVTYIKDSETFSKYLDDSSKMFESCYFMFSSTSDQLSYQSNVISHFTKSFIESVITYSATEIRYKHIIDYISDEFDKNSFQKPLFVTQASFTEVFCHVSSRMRTKLSSKMQGVVGQNSKFEGVENLSLVDLVIADSQRYCSKEEVIDSLDQLRHIVENYKYSSGLEDLYTVDVDFTEDYSSTSTKSIGSWLKENENQYFSKVEYKRKKIEPGSYSAFINSLAVLPSISGGAAKKDYVNVVSGFDLTVEVPFKLITIDAQPKYPNISWNECKIAFVFSRVKIRFFYRYSTFQLDGWENYSHDSSSPWKSVEVELKKTAQVEEAILDIVSKFESFTMDPIRAKYILTVEGVSIPEESEESEESEVSSHSFSSSAQIQPPDISEP